VDVAPEVFGLDQFNKAIVLDRTGAGEEKITDAAHACPVQAIILESDGGERIFPIIE
jgi:ferredoxin